MYGKTSCICIGCILLIYFLGTKEDFYEVLRSNLRGGFIVRVVQYFFPRK